MLCDKCEQLCPKTGFRFDRSYRPDEWLEGHRSSPVWIVGLNPAMEIGWQCDEYNLQDLEIGFAERAKKHPYFRNFNQVSHELFDRLGQPRGVAHTDIVKCASKSWPPGGAMSKQTDEMVRNCGEFLRSQIERLSPKLIICNGAAPSRAIQTILPPNAKANDQFRTAYQTTSGNTRVWVVLSGFIGRIDNFARRRLGREIEATLKHAGIDWM